MARQPANSGGNQDTRFKPGQSGNPNGRPAGSRNKATLVLGKLIDDEGEAIVKALIKEAVAGDVTAGKALLDRLVPVRRDRPVLFALPPLTTAADAPRALAAITAAVASGDLTPSEAADLAALVERFVRSVESADLERRISELEKRTSSK